MLLLVVVIVKIRSNLTFNETLYWDLLPIRSGKKYTSKIVLKPLCLHSLVHEIPVHPPYNAEKFFCFYVRDAVNQGGRWAIGADAGSISRKKSDGKERSNMDT